MAAPASEVQVQLDRLLSSQVLAGSDQLKRLLRLVVERTLNGQPDLVKEYNLGLEVFHRPPDYDPKTDPIVRVQARRLRAKLDEYYAGEGAQDTLIIQIPKGAYVPSFEARPVTTTAVPTRPRIWLVAAAAILLLFAVVFAWRSRTGVVASSDLNRSVAVLPLRNFTGDTARAHIPDQVAEVLTTELARNGQLRVLSRTTASKYRETKSSLPEIARTLGVRWVIEGGVGMEGDHAYLKLRAVDSTTDRKVWADAYDFPTGDLIPSSTRAARSIASAIETRLRNPQN